MGDQFSAGLRTSECNRTEGLRRAVGLDRLRVLAYHDVDDEPAFEAQLRHLCGHYEPVTTAQVLEAFSGGSSLPHRAVWVTFDDGHPAVVERGQAILDRYGIKAVMFVCPGLIEEDTPNWWDIVRIATEVGLPARGTSWHRTAAETITALKQLPDEERRALVEELSTGLLEHGELPRGTQLSAAQLERWTGAGHQLGNHSWDHPCLDRCPPEAQEKQVRSTDDWLRARDPNAPRLFAYPNGNATATVEHQLDVLGYDLALLFDHRIARTSSHPLRVSRLRVSAGAGMRRFATIVAGAHSLGYHAKHRLTHGFDAPSAVDGHNRRVYEQPQVVDRFASDRALMSCEAYVFDAYVPEGVAVLDLGVGAGRTTPRLSSAARSYVGIDYSQSMIDAARSADSEIDLRLGDAADLADFTDASVDVVVFSFNGLDYLHPRTKRESCIREMSRVVRPGGVVIISSHNSRALLRPRPGAASVPRSLAIQAYASSRLLARTLPSSAFRIGEGYIRDSASPHVNYATTPARVAAEFHRFGLDLRETVGSRAPDRLPELMEPWRYFVFQKTWR